MCIRWIYDAFQANEEFLGLYQMETCDAASIVTQIKTVLQNMNLSLTKLHGQCYDGCKTTSGPKSGVATTLKATEHRALYTHCYAHATNLACSDSIRQVKVVSDAHDTVHVITKLVKKSPKRETHLEKMKKAMADDDEEKNAPNIHLLCPVRWTVRGKALDSILQNYGTLHQLWDWSIANCSDTEMKARIRGVQKHMDDFDFYFGVALGETLLRHSDKLSAALQKQDMSAAQAQKIAELTRKSRLSMRNCNVLK